MSFLERLKSGTGGTVLVHELDGALNRFEGFGIENFRPVPVEQWVLATWRLWEAGTWPVYHHEDGKPVCPACYHAAIRTVSNFQLSLSRHRRDHRKARAWKRMVANDDRKIKALGPCACGRRGPERTRS